jgi:hypothetical protein
MGYYAYKNVRDAIPQAFQDAWEVKFKEDAGRDYEEDPGYDGDMWLLAADYIKHLEDRIKALEVGPDGEADPNYPPHAEHFGKT